MVVKQVPLSTGGGKYGKMSVSFTPASSLVPVLRHIDRHLLKARGQPVPKLVQIV